jgi:hypothetical protein
LVESNISIPFSLSLQEGRPEQRNLNDVSSPWSFPHNFNRSISFPRSREQTFRRLIKQSAALAAKVAKKAEMKKQEEEEAAKAAANQPVVRKKVEKNKDADLDDLLSAGLGKGKKK